MYSDSKANQQSEQRGAQAGWTASPLSNATARSRFASHDRQTQALIAEQKRLEALHHGESIVPLLEEWRWIDRMKSPDEKQLYLEPLIAEARRDPVSHEHVLLFLLIVLEPIRRRVSAAFMRAHSGLAPSEIDMNWANKTEARLLRNIEREALYDITRSAALELIYRYPSPAPRRFFAWARDTMAWRALDQLKAALPDPETAMHNVAEAEAIQLALSGFEAADPPAMGEISGLRGWRTEIDLRDAYETVEDFYRASAVSNLCRAAVGRLPERQAEVIEGHFWLGRAPADQAVVSGMAPSTVYNTKAHGLKNLLADDSFFFALHQLGAVRDRARANSLAAKYPGGRLPDGRRLVSIDPAA